jgi:NAD(P)-dependent dehydrogenase (short-subunit alcohol dehydrogenase family)
MDVADMTGKTVVVTGGNSGIGKQTALALARAGARVKVTARDQARGEAAVTELRSDSGGEVELVVFDLGDLAAVRAGAAELLARCDRIDVLVNNAGVVLSQRCESKDGFDATFAVNHLGPFLLTNLLLDRMKQSAPARIVTVASTAHKGAPHGRDFNDLQTTARYRGMQVYSRASWPTSISRPSWPGVSTAPPSRRTVSTRARWPPATDATATSAGCSPWA